MTAVIVPPPPAQAGAAYRRSGHLERPAVGAAALITTDGRTCLGARLRLGAIGSRPIRLASTESALTGLPIDAVVDELPRHAADEVAAIDAADDLHGSADYKRHLAIVLLRRSVAAALPAATTGAAT
jgi:carbon-monoxide dehydrogenase medium subunit